MAPVVSTVQNLSLDDGSISTGVLVVASITGGVLLIEFVKFLYRLEPNRLKTDREWLRRLSKYEIANLDLTREELYRLDRFCAVQQMDGQAGRRDVGGAGQPSGNQRVQKRRAGNNQADQLESNRITPEQAMEIEGRDSARELEVQNIRRACVR